MLSHGTLLPESGQNRCRRWDLTLLHLRLTDHDRKDHIRHHHHRRLLHLRHHVTQTSNATLTRGSSTSAITVSWHVEEIIKEQADGGSGLSLSRRGRNLNQPRADEGDDGRIPSTTAGHNGDGAGSGCAGRSGAVGEDAMVEWAGGGAAKPTVVVVVRRRPRGRATRGWSSPPPIRRWSVVAG